MERQVQTHIAPPLSKPKRQARTVYPEQLDLPDASVVVWMLKTFLIWFGVCLTCLIDCEATVGLQNRLPNQAHHLLIELDRQEPRWDGHYFINVIGTWAKWMTFMATEPKSRPW
jgi:hypothetical protein